MYDFYEVCTKHRYIPMRRHQTKLSSTVLVEGTPTVLKKVDGITKACTYIQSVSQLVSISFK
jgi:hypothetical protein